MRRRGFSLPPVFASARPQVFGHRGGLALGPENTRLAIARGLAAGADGIECDVRLSLDGVPVLIHDPTLERTTDATGAVAARTAAELARVDATCRFRPVRDVDAVTAPEGLPTLASILAGFPDARLIIELKDATAALADAVVALVRASNAGSRTCLGSFHHQVLAHVRSVAPEITTSASMREARWLLARASARWPLPHTPVFRALQVPRVAGRLTVVSPAFLRRAHQEHAAVQVWTVNDPEQLRRLFGLGVDGVITDRPDVAVAVRDAEAARGTRAAEGRLARQ
jgi:glycerophosphoryl diester phosphodiesterase